MRPSLKPRNLAISTGDFFRESSEQIKREKEREGERDGNRQGTTRSWQQASRNGKRSRGYEREKKVTPEKKSMRIAISELSSEPRAIDVRRKPILVEQEEERERERERTSEWARPREREREWVTGDRKANERRIERMRGVTVTIRVWMRWRKIEEREREKKRWEKIIQRAPTSLPTGRSAYI